MPQSLPSKRGIADLPDAIEDGLHWLDEAGSETDERQQSPRDRVVRDIVSGLYAGRIEAGQRLTEAQLTEEYGISRGPVREALNRLDAMGIVELMPQRGAVIRVLTLNDAIDSLIVAQGLLGITARLAAERIGESGRNRLRGVIRDLRSYDQASTSADYAMARDQFYSTLSSCAANAALSRILVQIQIHLIRTQFRPILRTVDRKRHQDYIEIADAICVQDGSRAERLMRRHMGRSISALQNFAQSQPAN